MYTISDPNTDEKYASNRKLVNDNKEDMFNEEQ